ncbi:hypothetical protein AQJ91_47705 [Streptomyces dysideae]|uniref:Uncharacterized protein n=1 Tax=Streptomyces dysideae TaxID=909626 RepID=A0A101UP23_9ACTN|nr:hypothetical protein AQJ91_47705 [Streptomyces dysideae]
MGEGCSALGRVESGDGRAANQLSGAVGERSLAFGTEVFEEALVVRACDDDGQSPVGLPGAAVARLQRGPVAGEAVGAVAGCCGEEPVQCGDALAGANDVKAVGDGRVAGCERQQGQGRGFGCGEPGGGLEVVHPRGGQFEGEGRAGDGLGVGLIIGQAGASQDDVRGDVQAVGEPHHVAGQQFAGQRIQASGERCDHRAPS